MNYYCLSISSPPYSCYSSLWVLLPMHQLRPHHLLDLPGSFPLRRTPTCRRQCTSNPTVPPRPSSAPGWPDKPGTSHASSATRRCTPGGTDACSSAAAALSPPPRPRRDTPSSRRRRPTPYPDRHPPTPPCCCRRCCNTRRRAARRWPTGRARRPGAAGRRRGRQLPRLGGSVAGGCSRRRGRGLGGRRRRRRRWRRRRGSCSSCWCFGHPRTWCMINYGRCSTRPFNYY